METRARYAAVGLFTLVSILALFWFAYWLNTAGGIGRRDNYRIIFDYSVSGLLVGSNVVFNGMRAGEVTSIVVDPENPRHVVVDVAIDPEIPVRSDTKAGIEFQGMMSSPVVSLIGGKSTRALQGELPVLKADPSMGQSMTASASETFQAITKLVNENKDDLKTSISNISTFTGALSRNSEKVDGILAGLERMVGGKGGSTSTLYDITVPTSFPEFERQPKYKLVVKDPVVPFGLTQDKILVRTGIALEEFEGGGRWVDTMPALVQLRLIQSFENAGSMREVLKSIDGPEADFQLQIDIRKFEVVAEQGMRAEVSFVAKLTNGQGELIATKEFGESLDLEEAAPRAAADQLNKCFMLTAGQLVAWASKAIYGAG